MDSARPAHRTGCQPPHPSDQITVQVYEGAAIAIDRLPTDPGAGGANQLLADGWVRYRRASAVPPQGQHWQYLIADH